ncbi:hypothetical protein [Clostridium folliculivorans]|uniref:VCBS repeat-containing protein n=1 Tax=Clostridium folliculivorans TaxID=2886038 RepID=A0A9W6DA74_9CLOT|nr:hypothetical protein [Clostridium folliculivorans]GKU24542.1 hypothetical protein CFOLD11_13680 [Clostridium folliculivorans]GKU30640.1 hypothetical protein CFB3_27470 [Clostridium folliculivorans]
MNDFGSRQIIAIKEGDVTWYFSRDKIILTGECPYVETTFTNNIELIVQPRGKKRPSLVKIPFSGYYFQIFLGDFNGDGRDEILVRGSFLEVRGYAIGVIYTYSNGYLEKIFDHEIFTSSYLFKTRYLDNYKIEVISLPLKEKYIIDISGRSKEYLDLLFDSTGKVKENVAPAISPVIDIDPVKSIYDDTYSIIIKQNVLGIDNDDVFAIIESFLSLYENKIKLISMGILTFGKKEEKITDCSQ